MDIKNKKFLEYYFTKGEDDHTDMPNGVHLFVQNILLREIAKSLAPQIIHQETKK